MILQAKTIFLRGASIALVAFAGTLLAIAQEPANGNRLPDAPAPSLIAQASAQVPFAPESHDRQTPTPPAMPIGQAPRLTLSEGEQMAIKNNPRISMGRLLALAQHQVVRETRAAELPTATAAITAEEAENASRISASSLTASRLFEHAGAGGGFTQLITDFGRTSNLVASSKLQEKAQNASALATKEDIVIATDQAYFNALEAQALLKVADQNVTTRQTTETQVSSFTKNNLKSALDLSFADVSLSQAKLLQIDARNNKDSTMAALNAVLGLDR
jgi:outer membrane protein